MKLQLKEAMELLTVAEIRTIEKHYGKTFDGGELSGTDLTVAVIWAHERRRLLGQDSRPDWDDFDSWTMREVNNYFAPDEIEIDPADPETAAGKDNSPAG